MQERRSTTDSSPGPFAAHRHTKGLWELGEEYIATGKQPRTCTNLLPEGTVTHSTALPDHKVTTRHGRIHGNLQKSSATCCELLTSQVCMFMLSSLQQVIVAEAEPALAWPPCCPCMHACVLLQWKMLHPCCQQPLRLRLSAYGGIGSDSYETELG